MYPFHLNMYRDVIPYSTYCSNGLSRCYFDVQRGLRQGQGDPCRCYLFVLALELLLINIRNNNNISGIEIDNNVQIKMSCYADLTNNKNKKN